MIVICVNGVKVGNYEKVKIKAMKQTPFQANNDDVCKKNHVKIILKRGINRTSNNFVFSHYARCKITFLYFLLVISVNIVRFWIEKCYFCH